MQPGLTPRILPPRYLRHKFYRLIDVDEFSDELAGILPDNIIYKYFYKNIEVKLVDEKVEKKYVTEYGLRIFDKAVEENIMTIRKMLQEQKEYENLKEGSMVATFKSRYHSSVLRVAAWADGYRIFFDLFPRTGKGVIMVPVFSFAKYMNVSNGRKEFEKARELVLELGEAVAYLDSQPFTFDDVVDYLRKWRRNGVSRKDTLDVVRHYVSLRTRKYGETLLTCTEGLVYASLALASVNVKTAEQLYKVALVLVRKHLREGGFPQPDVRF